MKKIFFTLAFAVIALPAQCLPSVRGSVGLKPALNLTTFNPDDGAGNYTGAGFNIGFGLGLDVGNFGIEMTPSFRTTNYSRTQTIIVDITTSGHFNNFYLPVHFLLKAGAIPLVAPYLGLGFAFDIQNSGYWAVTSGGTTIKTDVPSDQLENDLFFSVVLGADIKQSHFKYVPEITFDYNLTADDPDTGNRTESNYDFTISIGLYFTP
jgi:hypothetical protein